MNRTLMVSCVRITDRGRPRRKIFVYDTRLMIQSIFIFPSVVGGGVYHFVYTRHTPTHTNILYYIVRTKKESATMMSKKCNNNNNGEEKKNPRRWRWQERKRFGSVPKRKTEINSNGSAAAKGASARLAVAASLSPSSFGQAAYYIIIVVVIVIITIVIVIIIIITSTGFSACVCENDDEDDDSSNAQRSFGYTANYKSPFLDVHTYIVSDRLEETSSQKTIEIRTRLIYT